MMASALLLTRSATTARAVLSSTNIVKARSTSVRSLSTITEEKQAKKEIRRQRYEATQAKLAKLSSRREGRPTNVKKQAFTEWYTKRRTYHEIQDRKARQAGLEWKIAVAVVVERLPVVTPDVEDWEREYMELRAYLDQYQWEYPSELGMNQKDDDDDDDDEEKQEPLPRETEADASGDYQTMNRRLKTRIYYAQRADSNSLWGFPTTLVQENETLSQAAERMAAETLGDSMHLLSLSNAPVAVDLEVDEKKDGFFGTKTFFMKMQYLDGSFTANSADIADYGWLERTELAERAHAGEGPNAAKFLRYML